jgi:uncharacterized protein YjiK
MTRARIARVVAAALAVGGAAIGCRPADGASARIDTAELSKREARLAQALGQTGTAGTVADTSAGTVDTTAAADSGRDSTAAARDSTTATENGKPKGGKDGKPKDSKGSSDATDEVSAAEAGALARWVLPRELDEISGIALTADGRLLAHGDERAQISEIDYRRGVIVKQFVVGAPTLRADIEGITVAHGTVFLLSSKGVLYEFREGANGARVDFITSDTRLGKECEFEGLAFDPTINSLLLACKNVELKDARDQMVIYRWKLDTGTERLSQIKVPLSKILPSIGEKEFHPADITVDPKTGNYLIVASIEEALVEITPTGDVVFVRKLIGQHNQPESIAITKDRLLIIGDEAGRLPAALTLYPWPR